jgi:hypothetical protein
MTAECFPRENAVFTGCLAGLKIFCNCNLQRSNDLSGGDGEVRVSFVQDRHEKPTGEGWLSFANLWQAAYRLIDPQKVEIWLREDGSEVLIWDGYPAEKVSREERRGTLARMCLPFAAALQGKPVIHAAAVRIGDRAIVFVGESGAGKSTLAGELRRQGCQVLTDDLLPCRVTEAGVGIPLKGQGMLPVGSIYFLGRSAEIKQPVITTLTGDEHMLCHLENGFSELALAKIWEVQFRLYEQLAVRVPGYRLQMADDLGNLPEAVGWLTGRLGSG